ncbi:MAG: methyltransferase domain-containing protein [Chloroflexi bacterium]|nr:methyltransferase domain-containing protein [Chloroflexota bacterium]
MVIVDRPIDTKSLSQQRYSQLAQRYVQSATHAAGEDLERLFTMGDPQPDWHVLDVATGGGHTALRFAPHVAHMTVSDFSSPMLVAAEKHLRSQNITNAEYRFADAENLPFPDETYDLVTCRLATHHFPNPFRFVAEAHRVLKKGKYLLIQDHYAPEDAQAAEYLDAFESLRDPSHGRTIPESEWIQGFSHAGFTVVAKETLLKRHDLSSWAKRQDCSDEVICRLDVMLTRGPKAAIQWYQPRSLGSQEASFANPNLIIKGQKHQPVDAM